MIVAIAVLAVATLTLRLVGMRSSVLGRLLAEWGDVVTVTVLASLVVSTTLIADGAVVADARLCGVAVAAIGAWRQWPMVVILVAAVAATALSRALG
jgi:hypothetical protein